MNFLLNLIFGIYFIINNMLSKKVHYSISALLKLARMESDKPVTIREIASSEGLPKKYLEAILLDMKNLGIVASKKGKGGGYFLIKKPDEINLDFIIRKFDGAIAHIPCVSRNFYQPCEYNVDEKYCGLRDVFEDVWIETTKILSNTSIADILEREKNLILRSKRKVKNN